MPSTSANELFISGWAMTERTSAQPMRWVKLTLPPRPRARWLLITMRLSTSSLAGTARTEVAVGTSSEASMFCTILAATPRSVVTLAPAGRRAVGGGLGVGGRRGGLGGLRRGRRGRGGLAAGTVGLPGATVAAAGASVPALAAVAFALAAVASSGVTIEPVAIAGL